MSKVILVTGATGKQGGAVVSALLKSEKFTVLAVTRSAGSSSALKLASKENVKIVEGNLDDVPGIFAAAKLISDEPIWGVYSVQISIGKGVTFDGEINQGKSLIDESLKQGVKHFVYSSIDRGGDEKSWETETPIPHFQTKHRIELHLRSKSGDESSRMGWTILRPVAFMEVSLEG
jgi:uncharacterized protein YbjT (DUF2867 family)